MVTSCIVRVTPLSQEIITFLLPVMVSVAFAATLIVSPVAMVYVVISELSEVSVNSPVVRFSV